MTMAEAFAIVGYATCSSLMLIVNKLSMHLLPVPSFVLLMQFFTSWAAVKAVGQMGLIVVDALEWSKDSEPRCRPLVPPTPSASASQRALQRAAREWGGPGSLGGRGGGCAGGV